MGACVCFVCRCRYCVSMCGKCFLTTDPSYFLLLFHLFHSVKLRVNLCKQISRFWGKKQWFNFSSVNHTSLYTHSVFCLMTQLLWITAFDIKMLKNQWTVESFVCIYYSCILCLSRQLLLVWLHQYFHYNKVQGQTVTNRKSPKNSSVRFYIGIS